MQKSCIRFLTGISAILVLLTLSCSMDLEPVKAGDTAVSFTIGTLLPPANALVLPDSPSARAVAPGVGYLYIRTIGGPTGSRGPFYGPFTLASGDTFTTTNIPAGTYEGIGILYATERLDDLTAEWEGQTRTFAELMRLSDDKFKLLTDGHEESEDPSPLDLLLDGRASGEMLSPVTIAANRNNPLSLTLVPICGTSGVTMSEIPENNVYTETGDPDRIIRKFIELDGIVLPPEYTGNLICTIAADGSPYIGTVAMFGEDGRQIGTTTTINAALTANRTVSVPWTGGDTYYLYIEYRAASLSLAFSSDEQPVVVEQGFITLNIAGGTPNAKVLAELSPYTGEGTEEQPAVAVAVMTLDGAGNGATQFFAITTGEPYQFPAGQWFLNGFIDVNENYSDITAGEPLASILDIEPHHGDLTFEGLLPTTDGTDMDLPVINVFSTSNTYIYYISQTGTGEGQRVADAMSPVAFRNELLDQLQSGRTIRAYIIDNITLSSQNDQWTIGHDNNVVLTSLDPAQPETITIGAAQVIEVNSLSELQLSHVIIDGNNGQTTAPFLTVFGTCIVSDGTTIQNLQGNDIPGSIFVPQGGNLTMHEGALISGCSGGVFMENTQPASPPPNFTMEGGTIQNCTGSGIYISGYTNATLSGGTIDNCDTLNGGGVYISNSTSQTTTLSLSGVTIQNCDVTYNGGGVYAEGNTAITMQAGSSTVGGITHCTASTGGGGLYLEGQGNTVYLDITGGIISNCNSANGGGINAFGFVVITMSGGTIDSCTATNGGGGFYLEGSANLTFENYTGYLITGGPGSTPTGWAIWYGSATLNPDPSVYSDEYDVIIENNDIDALWWNV